MFWDGSDADQRVERWRAKYLDPNWGEVSTATLNGPSGSWLTSNILDPLRDAGAGSTFITDCLTTYRLSGGAAARLRDTYDPMVKVTSGLPAASLRAHPSESQIVREALDQQSERIRGQIAAARPQLLVSLGNAASRVVAALSESDKSGKLEPDDYGRPRPVSISGTDVIWIALVHPATPAVWQERHRQWLVEGAFRF
ncbi:hypothetical protein [Nocardioides sediminis]|uniref:hypothetical protein n=1 Tax=Nocardioides sediminis TaxID=433648 RepID=UPI00131ED910|nr:hypothetical protein [Nocardioides sediminis]